MRILFLLFLSLAFSMPLKAEETSPAYWETVELPEIFEVSRFPVGLEKQIFCSAFLLINNKLTFPKCYFDDDDKLGEVMFAAFRRANEKLERHRAKLNGKTKSVRLGFSLKLITTPHQKKISLLHAIETISEGTDFSVFAPQRITAVRPSMSLRGCNFNTSVWVNVEVDENGIARDVIFRDVTAKEDCLIFLKNQFLEASYIPAQRDGDAISGIYKEYVECRIKAYGCKLRYGT